MTEQTAQQHLLILNGTKYDLDKVRNIPGTIIEVKREDLCPDINCSEIQVGLHAVTAPQQVTYQENTPRAGYREYQSDPSDAVVVIKHMGKFLLLLGHATILRSTKRLVRVRLITTVAMKDRARLPNAPAPAEPAWVAPASSYNNEFKNTPRFKEHKKFTR